MRLLLLLSSLVLVMTKVEVKAMSEQQDEVDELILEIEELGEDETADEDYQEEFK